jgi:lysophospholipase L1-like esterase
MKSILKKVTLPLISFISLTATLLWIFGLGWTLQDHFSSNKKEERILEKSEPVRSKNRDDQIHIFALGDSLTRGTGDADGKGYAGYLTELLKEKSNKQISIVNTAVKGETSNGLLTHLQQNEIQRQVKQADVIVMTIGGNDLFQQGAALESLDPEAISKQKERYLNNVSQVYKQLRDQNNEAVIYHVGLYNPFSNLSEAKTTSAIVREWNFSTAEQAAEFENIVYVPTFDLFQVQVENYLYTDQFHPNKAGYKLIADRVASLITFEEEENS